MIANSPLNRHSRWKISVKWFHFNTPDKHYYPDALIPIQIHFSFQGPTLKMQFAGKQCACSGWMSIAADTKPGVFVGARDYG